MHWEEIWTSPAPSAAAFRALLTPASWLYAAGWQSYLAIYKLGLKKAEEPHRPVVCVGNLMVGGTGKSPLTLHLADLLENVVIGCSGYGSPAAEASQLAPEGEIKASEWGDEAAMIRWLRPHLPLIVGRRRVLGAELAHRHFPDRILLMDDGFQHLPLKNHLSILLDPPQPNHRCLPAGPYREPRANRSRAGLIIPGEFTIASQTTFIDPNQEPTQPTGEINVLCALGRPQGFLDSLRAGGLELTHVELRQDHDPLADGNLLTDLPRGRPTVVTAKDWVKLCDRPDVETIDAVIARQEITVQPEEAFRTWLRAKLNGIEKEAV